MAPMDSLASASMVKLIRVSVNRGRRTAYLKSQDVWNHESRRAAGYLGELVGDGAHGEIYVMTFWRSRAEYERWMETDHDRIAALADSAVDYTTIEVRTVDLLPT